MGKKWRLPSLSQVVRDPIGHLLRGDGITALGAAAIPGFGGALVGGLGTHLLKEPVKNMISPPKLPGVPYHAEPRAQQNALINNQLSAADKYRQNLGNAINEETAASRAGIQGELQSATRDLRGRSNASGMLFSGRRMAGEGGLANQASQRLAQARSGAIQKMLGQEQAMYAQPLRSRANIAETNMDQQGLLDKYRRETDSQRTQLMTTGMGYLGQGIGQYYGDKNKGV